MYFWTVSFIANPRKKLTESRLVISIVSGNSITQRIDLTYEYAVSCAVFLIDWIGNDPPVMNERWTYQITNINLLHILTITVEKIIHACIGNMK